jgi:erythronate-4-phosphate dehydrogenase
MRIVADPNIPFVERAFGHLGQVRLVSGRQICSETVADADILLVRSVTPVNAELLQGSAVRFVASATIGIDHVDVAWLRERGIGFAYAPGSNAESVAQYVCAALLHCARRRSSDLAGTTLGIVGVGNVGSRVLLRARALGMRCVLCDPPRARRGDAGAFVPLARLLAESDIVTLHVPLTDGGSDPTEQMVGEPFFDAMREGAWLVNTSRGRVLCERALQARRTRCGAVVLDVWEDEPSPSAETVRMADVATPHIAGYSYDGKLAGTQMVHAAVCTFLGVKAAVDLHAELEVPTTTIDVSGSADPVGDAVLQAYTLGRDDAAFRGIVELPTEERGAFFDALRRDYPRRLEFRHFCVRGAAGDAVAALMELGFQVINAPS